MISSFDPKEFVARIRQAFDGKTVDEIAELLGLHGKRAIYKWGSGETQPDYDRLIRISETSRVSIHWLLTGEGPMRIEQSRGYYLSEEAILSLRRSLAKVIDEMSDQLQTRPRAASDTSLTSLKKRA